MNYEYTELNKLCLSITDCPHSTPPWLSEGKLVIRNYNIKDGRLDLTDSSFTDEDTFNSRNRRAKPEAGDIIITREAPMGEVCIIPENVECCMGQRMVLLKPNPDKTDTNYLLYVLMSEYVQKHIKKSEGTGSIVSNLDISDLEQLSIPNLPLKLQTRIGNQLRQIDEKININKTTNKLLEELISTIYNYWFVQFDFPDKDGRPYKSSGGKMKMCEELGVNIPSEAHVSNLSDLVELKTDTFNPFTERSKNVEHYSIPAFDYNKMPVFENSTTIGSNKYKVTKKCILVSKLNPRFQRVWKPFCFTNDAICSTEFMVYEAKDERLINYCQSLFLSTHFKAYLVSKETGSTGSRKRVDPEVSMDYKFACLGSNVLLAYSKLIEPYIAIFQKNILENRCLLEYRNYLLPILMTGQATFK